MYISQKKKQIKIMCLYDELIVSKLFKNVTMHMRKKLNLIIIRAWGYLSSSLMYLCVIIILKPFFFVKKEKKRFIIHPFKSEYFVKHKTIA